MTKIVDRRALRLAYKIAEAIEREGHDRAWDQDDAARCIAAYLHDDDVELEHKLNQLTCLDTVDAPRPTRATKLTAVINRARLLSRYAASLHDSAAAIRREFLTAWCPACEHECFETFGRSRCCNASVDWVDPSEE
jgi:hypothetical protein